ATPDRSHAPTDTGTASDLCVAGMSDAGASGGHRPPTALVRRWAHDTVESRSTLRGASHTPRQGMALRARTRRGFRLRQPVGQPLRLEWSVALDRRGPISISLP